MNHTPTPWRVREVLTPDGFVAVDDESGRLVAYTPAREDANLLVQRVNAHKELVSVLKEADIQLKMCIGVLEKLDRPVAVSFASGARNTIRVALAKVQP